MSFEHRIENLKLEETQLVCGGVTAGSEGKSCTQRGTPKGLKLPVDNTMESLLGSNF